MSNKFLIYVLFASSFLVKNIYAQDNPNTPVVASNSQPATKFSPIGKWRAIFNVKPGLEIPINFEIDANGKQQKLFFLNGTERFEGGIVKQNSDSLLIKLDQFDNELAFKIEGDGLVGYLRKQDQTGKHLAITAERKNFRFKPTSIPATEDYSGTYNITFKSPDGKEEKTIGLFKQEGNKLTGTFLRITGDSRFLEGIVEGNSFKLSSFIGSNPSYYQGTFEKDGTIKGETLNVRGGQPFTGKLDKNAALPDPYKLTFLKDGYKTLDFSFPDVNGKKISLKDDKYKNKVVVLTITGSWCPNCIDEATFIAPWYKENKKRGVEVVGIHYERQTDSAYVRKVLTRFRERFGITYDQVIAGTADKDVVAGSLPALNSFISFPTTIIIDKQGNVAQIHTGYNGPATGRYYDEFVKEFNTEIDTLLAK